MFDATTIEIHAEALRRNLAFIRDILGDRTTLCSVVKGNAYGHGLGTFVPLAESFGVERFAVYSASEAYELMRHVSNGPDVYIMGDVPDDALDWAVEEGISFNAFEQVRLHRAIRTAKKLGRKARVHLEVETGMHRTGFTLEDLPAVLDRCTEHVDRIEVVGICTHLAGAENQANAFRIDEQKANYKRALELVEASRVPMPKRHVACSAAMLNEPDVLYDMARIGILQYGFWPNKETEVRYRKTHGITEDPLRRLIRWRGRVISTGSVQRGSFVGYGTSYFAQDDLRLAVVPVGYAFGYARSLSNSGHVLVRGQRAPVRGIVNMNCITIDITGIEGVEIGDEVVLIGEQDGKSVSVASFGELSDQLNYELLTRLPHDIPRVVVDEPLD